MTPAYAEITRALTRCSFLPGSWDKRFVRNMDARRYDENARPLSDAQRKSLRDLAHKYRRQLPAEIVTLAAGLGPVAPSAAPRIDDAKLSAALDRARAP